MHLDACAPKLWNRIRNVTFAITTTTPLYRERSTAALSIAHGLASCDSLNWDQLHKQIVLTEGVGRSPRNSRFLCLVSGRRGQIFSPSGKWRWTRTRLLTEACSAGPTLTAPQAFGLALCRTGQHWCRGNHNSQTIQDVLRTPSPRRCPSFVAGTLVEYPTTDAPKRQGGVGMTILDR